MQSHTTLLYPIITIGTFTKWRVDFITCNPVLTSGHKYIIVLVEYFTKWEEEMSTFKDDGETTNYFLFNQITTRFGILK